MCRSFCIGGVLLQDFYKTVLNEAQDEFTEKRSRFIGYCKPIKTEQEAVDFINSKRSIHWDATHNVYAYVLKEGNIQRYSDDGEPQGTAGVPVLDVIKKNNVVDCVVVATRYFGGILLGGGGLVRAYSHSAKIALDAAKVITMEKCFCCQVLMSYNQYGKVSTLIPQTDGIIDDSSFTDNVKILFHIPKANLSLLQKKLNDATSGEIIAEILYEKYFIKKE
ncbi:MAG: YigZ family protein [Ruminococcus sp.]|nr:YigZ family protein [Ruminococcus sp.]